MRVYLLVAVAALCTSLGVLIPAVWYLAIGGTALFLVCVWTFTSTIRGALATSALYSTIVSGAGVLWFWDAYPLSWLAVEHASTAFGLLVLAWVSAALAMSIGPALVGTGLWMIRHNFYRIPLAGLLCVLAEEGRMWGFALLTYAPSSPLGPHLSVTSLGYTLANSPFLLQFAALGGVHALTFIAGTIAAGIAVLSVVRPTRRVWYRTLAVVCVLSIVPFVRIQMIENPHTQEPLRVVVVSTQHPVGTSPDELYVRTRLTEALTQHPDLVIFPEGYSATGTLASGTAPLATDETIVMSTAHTAVSNGSYTVDLVYDSTTRGRIGTQSKEFLMPLGEYTPRVAQPLFSVLQSTRVNTYLTSIAATSVRGAEDALIDIRGYRVGGLLCSEALSPYLFPQLAVRGATLLVAMANPAWFGDSRTLHAKLLQVGRVHAVANNAYYLQASNVLPSFLITPYGTVANMSDWGASQLLVSTIR